MKQITICKDKASADVVAAEQAAHLLYSLATCARVFPNVSIGAT